MDLLEIWYGWIWFAVASLGIVTTLTTVVYLISNILANDKMKSWAKMELMEVFYSAMIITLALPVLTATNSIVQGALLIGTDTGYTLPGCPGTPTDAYIHIFENDAASYECYDVCGSEIAASEYSVYHNIDSCHMRLGIWYLREIFDETKNFAFDTYLSYIWTSMAAEFTINVEFIYEKAGFFTFNPWRGFFTMGNTVKSLAFDWAIKVMMVTKLQEVMLRFIAVGLFPSLFVIGAFFRTFTFTRRLGGLLLAIAIALYFIFPAFYAFGALVMMDLKNRAYAEWVDPSNMANPGNSDLLPWTGPESFPNPPIANAMYAVGDTHMIGGGSSSFSMDQAHQDLLDIETGVGNDEARGESPNSYFEELENSERRDNPLIPQFDLNADPESEAAQESTMQRASNLANSWFDEVAGESKFDTFINIAWKKNGPLDILARLTFWSLFFSLFSIIGTIAAIRSLSITFGGDIEIAGLTRLI
ncbi:hypothetical protein KKF81_02270 [Candidatus Micrarchaeota archaeon]|nr:hypothetical protein [Candidatus Micrarchaeota archaeon]MBU1165745.1 hypothetical protein [Candidatus Micrarchaeota archaeon]MBU1887498.1 hypothetical protein [Candidatus Micrarchaeota archaeon]